MTADRLQERNELARQLSAATSRVEARRERTTQAAAERDDLVIALAAAGMTFHQIAEIARLPTGRVAAIIGDGRRSPSRHATVSTGPASRTAPPTHEQRPSSPRPDRPRPTAPPPRSERRPPNQRSAPGQPPHERRRTHDGERWKPIAKRGLALIGTVFVALPVGLLAIAFALDATATLGGSAAGLLLLGVLTTYVVWRIVRRLRRIIRAARHEDESWLAVRTVRAKQGSLRTVRAEHGRLGVCVAVVMLAVFAWRAGRPPYSKRSRRAFAGRVMTVLGGAVVIVFAVLAVAGGVAVSVGALTGSEIVGGVAGYAVIAALAGWGVAIVRRRRRARGKSG